MWFYLNGNQIIPELYSSKTVKQMIQCHWAKKKKLYTSQLQMSSFLTATFLIFFLNDQFFLPGNQQLNKARLF